jgi:hypothetical protein
MSLVPVDSRLDYLETLTKQFFFEHEELRKRHLQDLELWRSKHEDLIKIWASYEKIHEKLKTLINEISDAHNVKALQQNESYKAKTCEAIGILEQKIGALKMTF